MAETDSDPKKFQLQPRRVFACPCGFSLIQVTYGSDGYVCEHCGLFKRFSELTRRIEKSDEIKTD